ncbi:AH receptor-interacting protein [Orchesella cincta]|uniref:peptidylprolyl isomerase n=1 Tax=Orchesella cincta TaxID=48709 RepID=A0A1D2ML30_ORCCI|nr:AH receptor-interacting protein [Orchesella cincta]
MSPPKQHECSKDCNNIPLVPTTSDSNDKRPVPVSDDRLLNEYQAGTLPPSVSKQVLRPGGLKLKPTYVRGTRIFFHFETVDTETGRVYDDTRTHPKPMELIFGKKFKIPIWELALHTMREGELSAFQVPSEMCLSYPTVAKVIRESNQPGEKPRPRSCCCSQLANGNVTGVTGHEDLDTFQQNPRDLTFTFEMLEVNLPGQYDMEACYMTDQEKATSIPILKAEGNCLILKQQFTEAVAKYEEAGSRLEHLLLKERPGTAEYQNLTSQKVPILLNLAHALLKNKDFYDALRRCDAALEIEPDNVKGLFRRGLAHKGVGSFEEARKDFQQALSLDSTLKKAVKEQMGDLATLEETHNKKLRNTLKNLF